MHMQMHVSMHMHVHMPMRVYACVSMPTWMTSIEIAIWCAASASPAAPAPSTSAVRMIATERQYLVSSK